MNSAAQVKEHFDKIEDLVREALKRPESQDVMALQKSIGELECDSDKVRRFLWEGGQDGVAVSTQLAIIQRDIASIQQRQREIDSSKGKEEQSSQASMNKALLTSLIALLGAIAAVLSRHTQ